VSGFVIAAELQAFAAFILTLGVTFKVRRQ
jgi:hypothetical protein